MGSGGRFKKASRKPKTKTEHKTIKEELRYRRSSLFARAANEASKGMTSWFSSTIDSITSVCTLFEPSEHEDQQDKDVRELEEHVNANFHALAKAIKAGKEDYIWDESHNRLKEQAYRAFNYMAEVPETDELPGVPNIAPLFIELETTLSKFKWNKHAAAEFTFRLYDIAVLLANPDGSIQQYVNSAGQAYVQTFNAFYRKIGTNLSNANYFFQRYTRPDALIFLFYEDDINRNIRRYDGMLTELVNDFAVKIGYATFSTHPIKHHREKYVVAARIKHLVEAVCAHPNPARKCEEFEGLDFAFVSKIQAFINAREIIAKREVYLLTDDVI
jgi:hypothetical protein